MVFVTEHVEIAEFVILACATTVQAHSEGSVPFALIPGVAGRTSAPQVMYDTLLVACSVNISGTVMADCGQVGCVQIASTVRHCDIAQSTFWHCSRSGCLSLVPRRIITLEPAAALGAAEIRKTLAGLGDPAELAKQAVDRLRLREVEQQDQLDLVSMTVDNTIVQSNAAANSPLLHVGGECDGTFVLRQSSLSTADLSPTAPLAQWMARGALDVTVEGSTFSRPPSSVGVPCVQSSVSASTHSWVDSSFTDCHARPSQSRPFAGAALDITVNDGKVQLTGCLAVNVSLTVQPSASLPDVVNRAINSLSPTGGIVGPVGGAIGLRG